MIKDKCVDMIAEAMECNKTRMMKGRCGDEGELAIMIYYEPEHTNALGDRGKNWSTGWYRPILR